MASGIQVYIGASTADLIAGLKDATGAIQRSTRQMAGDLQTFRSTTDLASSGTRSFTESIRAYKAEQVQEGRMVGFYVKELASFTSISKEASEALSGMGQAVLAIASGSIIGAAFEVTKTVVGLIRSAAGDAQAEMAKVQASFDKIVETSARAKMSAADATYRETLTDPAGEFQIETAKLAALGKERTEQERFLRSTRQLESALGRDILADIERRGAVISANIDAIERRAAMLRDQAKAGLKGNEPAFWVPGANTPTPGPERASKAGSVDGKAYAAAFREAVRDEKKDSYYGYRDGSTPAVGAGAALDDYRTSRLDAAARATDREAKAVLTERARMAKEADEAEKQRGKDLITSLEEQAAAYGSLGNQVGLALGEMAAGHKSLASTAVAAFKTIISALLETVKKQVMADAVASAAEAAKSQAGIPVIGPLLAGGAMVAMLSMVQGLLGSMPSAEGGWDLPKFSGGRLMIGHSREMMLPEKDADVIRSLRPGQRGTATSMFNFYGPVYDARGVRRLLTDHPRQVRDGLASLRRDGRI